MAGFASYLTLSDSPTLRYSDDSLPLPSSIGPKQKKVTMRKPEVRFGNSGEFDFTTLMA